MTILSLSFPDGAGLEVNTEDRVEVFRGETAQITCMFNTSEGIGGMVIQWFYVSVTKPNAHIHREVGCVYACDVSYV